MMVNMNYLKSKVTIKFMQKHRHDIINDIIKVLDSYLNLSLKYVLSN